MTERELRKSLVKLTYKEIPAETHRAFLSAISPGKEDEGIMKKKLSFSFVTVIAILFVLAAVAYAATEVYNRMNINWRGEVVEEPESVPQPTAEIAAATEDMDLHQIAERLVESAPEGEIVIAFFPTPDGGQSGIKRSYCQRITSWEELQQTLAGDSHITLPAWIPDGYHLQYAEISFKSKNDYQLIEEKQEGSVTLKRYSVDEENKIIDVCYLFFKDDENHSISITSTLAGNTAYNNSVISVSADASVTSVTVPGMENATAVSYTENNKKNLFLQRLLDAPVEWMDTPEMPPFPMTYAEEHIDIWATELSIDELVKMFSRE